MDSSKRSYESIFFVRKKNSILEYEHYDNARSLHRVLAFGPEKNHIHNPWV